MYNKILVVGNGSTAFNILNNRSYINKHTGVFLSKLNAFCEVSFVQFKSEYNKNNNLHNFCLEDEGIKSISIKTNNKLHVIFESVKLILKNKHLYLFYPGKLSKIYALICIFFAKKYGLYVRGQHYKSTLIDIFILKNASYACTVSPSIQLDLNRFIRNTQIIKPMIDIGINDLNYQRNYEIPSTFKLLFVGRVEYRKGIYELIDICEILKKRHLNYTIDIVGGGNLYTEINEIIVTKNLEKNITLHGLVSDKEILNKLYRSAHAFIFTSHDEGFPRVLYEAMASGLPIFTTFVGGISGRMEHLKNCIEIPVRDAKGASQVFMKHMNEKSTFEKVGKNGLKTVREILIGDLISHEQVLMGILQDEK